MYITLFRMDRYTEEEFRICKSYIPTRLNRAECHNEVVCCRYSALPYYQELEQDLTINNCRMVNTYSQHSWIANFSYYHELKDYTFETWTEDQLPWLDYDGPMVVKGVTNSRKHQWNKKMFAKNKAEAIRIACELASDDTMLAQQGFLFRKYEPLKVFEYGIDGLPFADEYRFFFFKDRLLECGYYWSIAQDADKRKVPQEAIEFARKIADIAQKNVNFFVVDVARKENGDWILVELNDGQMSGLSMCNPQIFYSNLRDVLIDYDKGNI